MVITEEFKTAIIAEINTDAAFGFQLFKAIMDSAGDQLVTTTYLDRALARQSKEFDEQLARLTEEFDKKLIRQSNWFDENLSNQTDELKQFIDRKLGRIGSRWGERVEDNYRRFAQKIVSQWGGTVTKWQRKIKTKDDHNRTFVNRYEVDIVVTNGKVLLIEMKSQCDLDDVERFLENAAQYVYLEAPVQPVENVILTFDLTAPAQEKADEAGITVIMPE